MGRKPDAFKDIEPEFTSFLTEKGFAPREVVTLYFLLKTFSLDFLKQSVETGEIAEASPTLISTKYGVSNSLIYAAAERLAYKGFLERRQGRSGMGNICYYRLIPETILFLFETYTGK